MKNTFEEYKLLRDFTYSEGWTNETSENYPDNLYFNWEVVMDVVTEIKNRTGDTVDKSDIVHLAKYNAFSNITIFSNVSEINGACVKFLREWERLKAIYLSTTGLPNSLQNVSFKVTHIFYRKSPHIIEGGSYTGLLAKRGRIYYTDENGGKWIFNTDKSMSGDGIAEIISYE